MSSSFKKSEQQSTHLHTLKGTTTETFANDIDELGEALQDSVLDEFIERFPGEVVDDAGYLRCTKLLKATRGLYFSVDKNARGVHLLALPQLVRGDIHVPLDRSLDALIKQARSVGLETKSIAGLMTALSVLAQQDNPPTNQ